MKEYVQNCVYLVDVANSVYSNAISLIVKSSRTIANAKWNTRYNLDAIGLCRSDQSAII